jgi:hypothetical protein
MDLGSEIRDPGKTYSGSRIPDPGIKKAPDPGSGSATLVNRIKYFRTNILCGLLPSFNLACEFHLWNIIAGSVEDPDPHQRI